MRILVTGGAGFIGMAWQKMKGTSFYVRQER